jgi:hypothetical protein
VKKILGDAPSFFGNGEDTLLHSGAALMDFAAKPDSVFAPNFLGLTNKLVQAGVSPPL